ncbi:MAG: hypothetical protein K2P20_07325, partial [Oscillospiraceae bacterium]|nr:hypothetical protein [Oscillospiraceae bacterium]
DATPREMKDQIMSLLDAWKEKQPPERTAPEKKTDRESWAGDFPPGLHSIFLLPCANLLFHGIKKSQAPRLGQQKNSPFQFEFNRAPLLSVSSHRKTPLLFPK